MSDHSDATNEGAWVAKVFEPISFTAEQYAFIDCVVRNRRPLPDPPLPLDDGSELHAGIGIVKCDSCDELPPDLPFPNCKCFE